MDQASIRSVRIKQTSTALSINLIDTKYQENILSSQAYTKK
jgi:hypothetical protein